MGHGLHFFRVCLLCCRTSRLHVSGGTSGRVTGVTGQCPFLRLQRELVGTASGQTSVQERAVWEPSSLLQISGNAMGKVPPHGFEYLKDILLPAVSLMPAGVCVMEFSGAPDACPRSPEACSPTQRLMPTCGLERAEGRAVGPPVPQVLKDSGHVPGGDVPFSPLQAQTAEETLPS